jgi:phosphopantothenoylcysteine decarboxylase/phosphopantothenate--cysteine ligase
MYDIVLNHFDQCDVYIGSAAIADFTPTNVRNNKIKKKDGFSKLILKPTKDILKEISQNKKDKIVIGFSVETNDDIENSKSKLIKKNLDIIVVNNPREEGAAFDADTNVVSIINRDGSVESWPIMSKLDVAFKLMSVIRQLLEE